ncbi:MAG: 4Fe-4S binding protein [Paludibacteraceae bacterium]|nr:4Fe-4S binding protein [Paludibacteraceae bacterium]
MAKIQGAVTVDTERCKGCELCVAACPSHVLGMSSKVNSKGYHYSEMVNAEACIGCASCGHVCPDACISVYKVKLQ